MGCVRRTSEEEKTKKEQRKKKGLTFEIEII